MNEKLLNCELDLQVNEYGYKEHITATQKKYFKYALEYAIKNKTNSVKVNRIKFYFDFNKMQVMIGTSLKNSYIYKLKK